MARKQRVHFYGAVYHVIARGNNKEVIFKDKYDKYEYLELIKRYKKKFDFSLFAYVLMENHVHLAVEVKEEPLSSIMQGLQLAYTQYFNKKYSHVGHVFQQRFKALLCDNDPYLLALIKYIHRNPVRAQLATTVEYPWSSHRNYLNASDSLVDINYPLSLLSSCKQEALSKYLELVGVPEDEQTIEKVFNNVWEKRIQPGEKKKADTSLENVVAAVSETMGVSEQELFRQSRKRYLVAARNLVIFQAVRNEICSRTEVSKFFGISQSVATRGYNSILDDSRLMELSKQIEEKVKIMHFCKPDPSDIIIAK